MCIAVIKPKNVDFPTREQLYNCFITNPHGSGFMYSDGENLIIKKGFMTFEDFMSAFEKENISKDKLVFFHFRIATHGLIDEGNTHPFPVSMNVQELRAKELKYKGYGMIHNGIFLYPEYEFFRYDASGIISDTMLFAMKLKESLNNQLDSFATVENSIAYDLKYHDNTLKNLISNLIHYNKVAIMNEKEEYVKYGNWIEDNGIFYSNDDYLGEKNYSFVGDEYIGEELCSCCGNALEKDKCYETSIGYLCDECRPYFRFTRECKACGMLMFDEDDNGTDFCDDCLDYLEMRTDDEKFTDEYDEYVEDCH